MGQECAGMMVNWTDKEGQQDTRRSHGGDSREESLMMNFLLCRHLHTDQLLLKPACIYNVQV